jgi:hypothetical protein
MPFKVPDREYLALAKFSNAAEDHFKVKALNLESLDHQRPGLVLEMTGGYELRWESGAVMLGRCHSDGRREQLFRGSAAVESTWAKMLDVMRSQEQKVKLEANRPRASLSRRAVRFDLEALRKEYRPQFDRARQIRQ